ncbi:MAG: serine/threonine-protein kinase [Gemmatimonadaceae bacterium]
MDAERWQRVQEIFHEAADLPREAQAALLSRACGADAVLRAEVEALLTGDENGATLVDRDVAHVARSVLPDAASIPIPSNSFGPYRLTRVLGEGGMGIVYGAHRDDLSSVAAVKILRDAWLSPARRERFVNEQRTLAQLNHPAIAHLYDAGTLADGTPWIAMEYVAGEALGDHCRRRRLALRERLQLVRAVCEAVLHAHQHLVIHRDLKPSNILVRADGSVKLLDFGIAKQLEEAGAAAEVTRTGLRLLTPAYAAPEQVLGQRVGVHTDVYSLGVILYELLAGALPFDLSDKTPRQAEAMIVEQDPPPPSMHQGGIGIAATRAEWEDLDVLVLTAMHKDPARRYRSVDALVRDIDNFLSGQPLDARADTVGYRLATFVRRNRRAVSATAAAALAAVVLVSFYTVRLAQARDRALTESVRAQRIQRFMTNLFQGGDEGSGPADSLRVVTLLADGVVQARALDQEPMVQADLYQTPGNIYRQLGELDRADSLLTTGMEQWRRIAGDGSAEVARASVALGDLRTDQARFDEAEQYLRAGVRTLERARPSTDPDVAQARIALGRSLTERGEYARAIAELDSVAIVLRARGAESPELLDGLGELASAHFYAGAYDVADSLNREVLAMSRRLYGDAHPRVAEDLMNLGATEQERGNYKESERYFREALSRTVAFHGENHFRTAGNLVYLGRSLLLQHRTPEAKAAFARSLAIRERVFGASHPNVANTLNEIGNLAIQEERYDEATAAFLRVRDIYRLVYPGLNYRTGVATANLADSYLYKKDYRRAEPLYRDALRHYIASQGPEHLNTGIGYIKLGRCLMRSGRFREGEPETQRGYAIVAKIASPDVGFLQAARLDLSIMYDSLGNPTRATHYRAEREKYLPKPASP